MTIEKSISCVKKRTVKLHVKSQVQGPGYRHPITDTAVHPELTRGGKAPKTRQSAKMNRTRGS